MRERPRTPSLETSITQAPSCRRSATSTRVGSACLRALRTASTSTDCASGSSSRGHGHVRAPGGEHDPELGMRRAGAARPPRAASSRSRARCGRAGAAARGAGRAAPACSSTVTRSRASARQLGVARHDEQDAEQPLDDALVDLAREVDALLQLARALALERRVARGLGQRGRLAERPQQVALAVGERRGAGAGRRGSRRSSARPPRAGSRRASSRRAGRGSARAPRAATASASISITRSSTSAWRAIGADSTVTWESAKRSGRSRRRRPRGRAGAPRRSGR